MYCYVSHLNFRVYIYIMPFLYSHMCKLYNTNIYTSNCICYFAYVSESVCSGADVHREACSNSTYVVTVDNNSSYIYSDVGGSMASVAQDSHHNEMIASFFDYCNLDLVPQRSHQVCLCADLCWIHRYVASVPSSHLNIETEAVKVF